jgi:hypothetical protein
MPTTFISEEYVPCRLTPAALPLFCDAFPLHAFEVTIPLPPQNYLPELERPVFDGG